MPAISLIGSTIRHLLICQASGTLVIPVWPSAYFWPLVYPRGKAIATFVKDFYVFDPFFKSNCSISVFKGHAKFRTIALKIAF